MEVAKILDGVGNRTLGDYDVCCFVVLQKIDKIEYVALWIILGSGARACPNIKKEQFANGFRTFIHIFWL